MSVMTNGIIPTVSTVPPIQPIPPFRPPLSPLPTVATTPTSPHVTSEDSQSFNYLQQLINNVLDPRLQCTVVVGRTPTGFCAAIMAGEARFARRYILHGPHAGPTRMDALRSLIHDVEGRAASDIANAMLPSAPVSQDRAQDVRGNDGGGVNGVYGLSAPTVPVVGGTVRPNSY